MKQLFESILDADNNIDSKSKPWSLVREFCSKCNNKSYSNPLDALGQPLEKGDLVLTKYVNSQIRIGIIIEIRGGMCYVCCTGDPKDLERKKTPSGEYRTETATRCILKIAPEIAEMILNQK